MSMDPWVVAGFFLVGLFIIIWPFSAWLLFIFVMMNAEPKRTSRSMKAIFVCGVILAGVMGVVLLFNNTVTFVMTREVRQFLKDAGPDAKVTINGTPHPQSERVISELLTINSFRPGHKSHPLRPGIEVVVIGETGAIAVTLRRDSQRKDEYWVYSPKYGGKHIARMTTSVFDAYGSVID